MAPQIWKSCGIWNTNFSFAEFVWCSPASLLLLQSKSRQKIVTLVCVSPDLLISSTKTRSLTWNYEIYNGFQFYQLLEYFNGWKCDGGIPEPCGLTKQAFNDMKSIEHQIRSFIDSVSRVLEKGYNYLHAYSSFQLHDLTKLYKDHICSKK